MWAFSICVERGLLFAEGHGLLIAVASPVVKQGRYAHGFSSCGSRALLLHSVWDLPGPGIEPVSSALVGGFLTTGPRGKSIRGTLEAMPLLSPSHMPHSDIVPLLDVIIFLKCVLIIPLCVCAKPLQSCPTLCSSMDCSPPGSSALGILQARRRVGCHARLQGIFRTQGLTTLSSVPCIGRRGLYH